MLRARLDFRFPSDIFSPNQACEVSCRAGTLKVFPANFPLRFAPRFIFLDKANWFPRAVLQRYFFQHPRTASAVKLSTVLIVKRKI